MNPKGLPEAAPPRGSGSGLKPPHQPAGLTPDNHALFERMMIFRRDPPEFARHTLTDTQLNRLLDAAREEGRREMSDWKDEPPEGDMFIWARPKYDGKWGLGLGYWTVSGTWRDSYSSDTGATRFHKLPGPPTS